MSLIVLTTDPRYAQPAPGQTRDEDEDRPAMSQHELADGTTLLICNGDDYLWRAPVDELRDMAKEVEQDNAHDEYRLSKADRQQEFHERWLDHLERKELARRRAFKNFLKGR